MCGILQKDYAICRLKSVMMIEQFGVALGYFDVSLDVRMVSKTGRRFLQDIFHLLGQDGVLVLVTTFTAKLGIEPFTLFNRLKVGVFQLAVLP